MRILVISVITLMWSNLPTIAAKDEVKIIKVQETYKIPVERTYSKGVDTYWYNFELKKVTNRPQGVRKATGKYWATNKYGDETFQFHLETLSSKGINENEFKNGMTHNCTVTIDGKEHDLKLKYFVKLERRQFTEKHEITIPITLLEEIRHSKSAEFTVGKANFTFTKDQKFAIGALFRRIHKNKEEDGIKKIGSCVIILE